MFEKRVDEFIKRDTKLKENCQAAYSLVLGQCTEYMRAKLEVVGGYNNMDSISDLIELIKMIKGLIYQFEGQQSKTRGRLLAHKRFHQLTQTRKNDRCSLPGKVPHRGICPGTVRRDYWAR
jgi:hypothetical protein